MPLTRPPVQHQLSGPWNWRTCARPSIRRSAPRSSHVFSLWGGVRESRRHFGALFEDEHRQQASEGDAVAIFKINADHLEKSKTMVDKKATGIPFRILQLEEVLDRVRRHHGTAVELVERPQRLLLPFWLTRTAAGGSFKADLLQRDPAFMTQQHCLVWVEGPRYEFSYPFDEYLPVNQTFACYTEPLSLIESCCCGSHIPSMLVSRFELLQEMEETLKSEDPQQAYRAPLHVMPFTMSTSTALSIVEKRVTRALVMQRIEMELKKFHGSFLKSNISLTSVSLHATNIRPVFLPLYKLSVTTRSSTLPVPVYVCGATGKTVGPVISVTPPQRRVYMSAAGAGSFLALAATTTPAVAVTGALAAAMGALWAVQLYRLLRFRQQRASWTQELKKASVLNLPSDSVGFRWSVAEEERQEFEYREELRQRARRRDAFQQRVKEESSKESARRFGRHVNPKNRCRTDLHQQALDPLGYYALLGLSGKEFTATSKDIAMAFRVAVRIHHPDVRMGQFNEKSENASTSGETTEADSAGEDAKVHMQKLLEAYKVLHNEKSRQAYDRGDMKTN